MISRVTRHDDTRAELLPRRLLGGSYTWTVPVDLAIVGAGPAGLAVAIEAAERGLTSVVVEREKAPIDKACGEGLMPRGHERLLRLGVVLPSLATHPIEGIRYVDGETSVSASFQQGSGVGVRRLVLSEALTARAAAAGADLRHGVTASGWDESADGVRLHTSSGDVDARWLVAADGLRSPIRTQAGIPVRSYPPRFGARCHYRVQPWSRLVEVHWAPSYEAYVTPVGPDSVGVALLWGGGSNRYDERLERLSALRARLGRPDGSVRGAGPFGVLARRLVRGRVILAGDAAGFLDAITGEGVGIALESAGALVDAIARDRPEEYERRWRRLTRRHHLVTGLLVAVARRPRRRRILLTALSERPQTFEDLLSFHTGGSGLNRGLSGLAWLSYGVTRVAAARG